MQQLGGLVDRAQFAAFEGRHRQHLDVLLAHMATGHQHGGRALVVGFLQFQAEARAAQAALVEALGQCIQAFAFAGRAQAVHRCALRSIESSAAA
ncbi:hypothetical protein G6F57_022609 [Rhizopus arrhizus]|nr:hypothetical protein G6F57_022609 [Rhizopus arrhizus]